VPNLKNEIDQALRVRDSQQTAAREARKHAGGMWLGAGQKYCEQGTRRHVGVEE
jgi:hypothetical protein